MLMDTGISEMLLWLHVEERPPALACVQQFPDGVHVAITVPPLGGSDQPALQYAFTTGSTGSPMAPVLVEWRSGHGINTGRHVMAGADYLFDAALGRVGFRMRSQAARGALECQGREDR